MARLLQHLISPPEPCSYLPDARAELESRIMVDVTPDEVDYLLARGWRRFGPHYFRPICPACRECVGVRVVVDEFTLTRSQRRVLREGAHLRRTVAPPTPSPERLALYHAWHAGREEARGWREDRTDERSYALQFCFPHPCAREMAYFEGDRLVCVGITDETPEALSLVYCFYAPDRAELSLGTYNVLASIELARALKKRWVYLGYRVEGCASLRYKGRFRPQELLLTRPELGDPPEWTRAEPDAGEP